MAATTNNGTPVRIKGARSYVPRVTGDPDYDNMMLPAAPAA
jgi:hypothetical protein